MSTPLPGHIGRYRPVQLVYSGQSTRLWKAYDDEQRRNVAIKMLTPLASKDRSQVAFLRREFKIGSTLSSDKLVSAYEMNREDGVWFLAMEWFPAPSVKQLVHLGYANYAPILPTLIPLLFEALIPLHAAGYVHCDIKPDNFLFAPEAGIRLIDYALVRKKGGFLEKFLPKGKTIAGTATYMSPEQIRKKPLDARADLYCLGGTILELFTGQPPFAGNSMNDLLQKHLSGAIPSITSKNKNVTPQFNDFVRSLLAVNPNDRPSSAADALGLLRSTRIFVKEPTFPA